MEDHCETRHRAADTGKRQVSDFAAASIGRATILQANHPNNNNPGSATLAVT